MKLDVRRHVENVIVSIARGGGRLEVATTDTTDGGDVAVKKTLRPRRVDGSARGWTDAEKEAIKKYRREIVELLAPEHINDAQSDLCRRMFKKIVDRCRQRHVEFPGSEKFGSLEYEINRACSNDDMMTLYSVIADATQEALRAIDEFADSPAQAALVDVEEPAKDTTATHREAVRR